MIRAHKIRLDPSALQVAYFVKACGTARFAYNWALAEWKRQYEAGLKPNEGALRRQLNAVKAVEFPWMAEVTKCAPQAAIKNLGSAYKRFFESIKTGGKPGVPRFKQKGVHDSFRADNGPVNAIISHAVRVVGNSIDLPRCGTVKMREELRFKGRILSATVCRAADGWYVALAVDTEERLMVAKDGGAIGVDLGVKDLATLSDGTVFPTLKPHRAEHARLVRLSRSLSRKKKGSANWAKAKTKLARLHLRIANIRKDVLHKLTTYLATNYSLVGIEDLNVSGMLRNKHLARSIADAGFGEFRRQLEYKTRMTGTEVIAVDRFFPSSKLCSSCGHLKLDMSLRVREWTCMNCEAHHCRDLNAALNIRRQALSQQSVERTALAHSSVCTKPSSMKQKKLDLHRNVQIVWSGK